jgi:outer membrane protein assembly factor BamE (lipoprotein component of BamABCDE complex)
MTRKLINLALLIVAIAALGIMASVAAQAQGQKARTPMANALKAGNAKPQPLYVDYKGVRIGMTADEARAKLGEPTLKGDDQDFYVFSEKETAQIVYDATHKVTVISVDYVDGAGAPAPQSVVGGDLEARNGSIYKLVRYESQGFWVSYNRTAGPAVTVSITIQKIG